MSKFPSFDAEVFLECQNTLGEGISWDSESQLLHWVDLHQSEIHTLDPVRKNYSVDHYPESKHVTAVAGRRGQPGMIGTLEHSVAFFPEPTKPTSQHPNHERTIRKTEGTVSKPLPPDPHKNGTTRFNDGAADPQGRLFVGSMTGEATKDRTRRGEFWRIDPDGTETKILDNIGCSNGLGWSPDHKTMYYVDSADNQISMFDYDVSTGTPSNRRVFAPSLDRGDGSPKTEGSVFDGLCWDGQGNLWVARWKDSRVVGFRPNGSVICEINTPKCRSPTIPIFGGKNLDTMYIATAHAELGGPRQTQDDLPHSGDLFAMSFREGTEIRKLLGHDWKGAERFKFAG